MKCLGILLVLGAIGLPLAASAGEQITRLGVDDRPSTLRADSTVAPHLLAQLFARARATVVALWGGNSGSIDPNGGPAAAPIPPPPPPAAQQPKNSGCIDPNGCPK